MSDQTKAERHKALHRKVSEALWNEGNVDAVDDHLHPSLKTSRHAEGMGPAELKKLVAAFRKAIPDLRITIDHQVAEGDELVSFTTIHGTHKGKLGAIAPTNKQVAMKGTCHTRFQDDKVVEETVLYDQLDILRQLGVKPEAGNVFVQALRA